VTRKGNGSLQNSNLEERKEDGEITTRRYTLRKQFMGVGGERKWLTDVRDL
jgi:hypothetical protein